MSKHSGFFSQLSIRGLMPLIMFFVLNFAPLIFADPASDVGDPIKSSIQKIIDIVTLYIIPGLATLVIIGGAVSMMQGRPDALKTIIMAVIGLIVSLSANKIIALVQSSASTTSGS